MRTLTSLPTELIHNIIYALVAHHPLGPPTAILPLLCTSKGLHAIASAPALLARIARLKFDVGAVTRRLFHPYTDDLAEQLVHACRLLQALRRGDVNDIDADGHLFTALLLMLDNDGKNYAQLEWAGVHVYVDEFVQQKLWVGREANDGWPLDNQGNACALWLMWLTMDRQRLLAESPRECEEMVLRILPYVFLHHRYAASAAPPNHFHLPLSPTDPTHQPALAFPIPSSPQNLYPHYLPPRSSSEVHFRARTELTPPLARTAAKLLYVVRREIRPIAVPPHLPPTRAPGTPGLTQEDYQELGRARAAVLLRGARWDWDGGRARGVNLEDGEGEGEGGREGGGGGDGERPKFAPGAVFTPGCMRGMWKGKIYIPQGNLFNQLLHSPMYPSIPDACGNFSEASLGVIMQPVFLDVQEHHRVCLCAGAGASGVGAGAGGVGAGEGHGEACGTVPVPPPAPRDWAEFQFPWVGGGPPPPQQQQNPNVPPQNVGGDGQQNPNQNLQHQNVVVQHVHDVAQQQPQNVHQQPQNVPAHAHAHVQQQQQQQNVHAVPADDDLDPDEEDEEEDDPSATQRAGGLAVFDRPARTDNVNSMSNAWFPGRLGEVAFAPRRVGVLAGTARVEGATESGGAGAGRDKTGEARRERRDEMVFALDGGRPDLWAEGRACVGVGAGVGAGGGSHSASNVNNANSNAYVYETYDPKRVSAHECHQVPVPVHRADAVFPPPPSSNPACARCAGIERARRAERRRAEREAQKAMARRVLDGALRAFGGERDDRRRRPSGTGDGGGTGEEEEEEEGMRMKDLDVRGFGLRLEGEEGEDNREDYNEQEEEDDGDDVDAQIEVLGDDFPEGQPAFWVEEPFDDEHGPEEEEQAQRREGGVRMDVDDPSFSASAQPPSASKPPQTHLHPRHAARIRPRPYNHRLLPLLLQ
ncbi:hypothetical protein BDZ97DRAFT_1928581 [Flammula alnicola]|nr:hypothetical protein BDZ97DRAFT_1928581 [Flammula alnicola]